MSKKSKCQIKCLNCKKWFSSPIQFEDSESFFTSYLMGYTIQCPHCKKMTLVNNHNIFFDAEMTRKDKKKRLMRRWKSLSESLSALAYIVLFYLSLIGIFVLIQMIFPIEPQMKNISVYEERDGTTYSINSTLEYRDSDLYVGDKIKWYLNSTEIWFKKEPELLIGNKQSLDYIFATYCLDDGELRWYKCFRNIKLDKITDNASEVLYANNTKLLQEIKFMSEGKKNLVVTFSEFPAEIFKLGNEEYVVPHNQFSTQTFTSFNGSELMVYVYIGSGTY